MINLNKVMNIKIYQFKNCIIEGKICGLLFNRNNYKCEYIIIKQNDKEYLIAFNKNINLNNDIVILNGNITLISFEKLNLKDYCKITNLKIYNLNGKYIGTAKSLLLSRKNVIKEINVNNKAILKYEIKYFTNNTIILKKDNNKNFNKLIKIAKAHNQNVKILNEYANKIKPQTLNKNIMFRNEIMFKKGQIVNKSIINKAEQFGLIKALFCSIKK